MNFYFDRCFKTQWKLAEKMGRDPQSVLMTMKGLVNCDNKFLSKFSFAVHKNVGDLKRELEANK